ncbi:MAG: hypothetical protein IT446_16095 [Phycisphaerales bacterium]|nr:hypothetical protein [Phycisphaerales bacterium]
MNTQPLKAVPDVKMTTAQRPAPRSDGTTLHVDFEDVGGGVFMNILNAGVRWLGDPFSDLKQGVVTITDDPALSFGGSRAAHVRTDEVDQRGRIMLQRRFDAPPSVDDVVAEFVFRVTEGAASDLDDFVLWSTQSYEGGPCGIALYGCGHAGQGAFDVVVEDAQGELKRRTVAAGLPQNRWHRFILHKQGGNVALWIGEPNQEAFCGEFEDIEPEMEWGQVVLGDLSNAQGKGSGYWDDVRIGGRLTSDGQLAGPEKHRDIRLEKQPPIRYPIHCGGERQLFVDDVLIQSTQGVKRTFHAVDKYDGNPILKPDQPWEIETNCILPMSVHRDPAGGEFRVWYGIWGRQVNKPTYQACAISEDGIVWHKPELGLHEFEGSTRNNIVREGRMFCVMPHPDDPDPKKRYKAAIRDAGFLAGYSPDGLSWTTTVPILDQSLDATSVHWDPVNRHWIASCKIFWNGVRMRGYAQSADFEHWTDTCLMLGADEHDHPRDQTYAMHIVRHESVYVGLLKMYHLESDRCDVQVAFSRNGRHWDRPSRAPFIANSPQRGTWDYGNIDSCTGCPIVVDDQLRFYYSGRSTLHNQSPNDGAMGLATLRRDGFASMDATENGGSLITYPVKFTGKQLYLNADVNGGEIRVELLDEKISDSRADEADVPIFPFLKVNCTPIRTDGTRHLVQWNNPAGMRPADLRMLHKRPVRIRFYLKNAKLYSFWTE